jgi:hypothetical protein
VKVLDKKRGDYLKRQIDPKRHDFGVLRYQVAWYSVSLILYGWFLGWIAYDLFVWHKPIFQVSLTNYVGAITAMALLYAGTKLFYKSSKVVVEQPLKNRPAEKRKRKHQGAKETVLTLPQKQPAPSRQLEPPQQHQLEREEVPATPKPATPPVPGCGHHFGYLSQPRQSKDFPEACLMCGKLIECGRATQ